MSRSAILWPRAIRYTKTPRNGRKITKITHSALATPPMSWLRKMSKMTRNRMMIQAIQRNRIEHRPEDAEDRIVVTQHSQCPPSGWMIRCAIMAAAAPPMAISPRVGSPIVATLDLRLDDGRAVHVRRLRAVPAALPDVPGHRGGGPVAPWSHRRDARRAVAGRRCRRRVRALHGDVRAVPRLRAGLPQRRAVRAPDGAHARGARRRPPHGAAVVARRARRAAPPPCCCSPARRCWRSPSGCASCRARAGLARLPVRRGRRARGRPATTCGCSPAA